MKKIISLLLLAFLAGCGNGNQEKKIELPSTQVMGLSEGWAVVLTNYVRIRATPQADGIEITALAKGAVVKIVDKGNSETVKNVTDFWYEVESGGNRGWLFGQNLKVFHDQMEAEKAVAEIKGATEQ
jgi:uncharacterized protein YgiM (DUF1202 family)